MAFLGSLGKAIGLGQFKSRDIVQGIATGVNEQLKDSMDKTDDNVSRLAQLRLDRVLRDQQQYDTDVASNLEVIKDMEGKVGSADAVAYLINEYGYKEAQTVAAELNKRRKESGGRFKPAEFLGVEQTTGGKLTAIQLADYVTPSKTIASASEFSDPGVGLASALFGYGKEDFRKRSDAEIAALGLGDRIGKTSIQDIPSVEGRDIYEWEVYTDANPAKQAANLTVIIKDLAKDLPAASGDEETAIRAEITAAQAERTLLELEYEYQKSVETKGKAKPLKLTEVERYANIIDGIIATEYQMAEADSWTYDSFTRERVYNYSGMSMTAKKEIQNASADMLVEINKAHLAGMDAAEIRYYVKNAITKNQQFKFIPAADVTGDPSFEFDPDSRLINTDLTDSQGQRVFTGAPSSNQATGTSSGATGTTGTTGTTSATASVSNPQVAAIQNIANKKQAYQSSNNPTAKAKIVTDLLQQLNRMNAKNPATNQPFTQAELETELSK